MQVVMRNFRIYLAVEVALLLISLLILALVNQNIFLRGAAIGMAIQATLTAHRENPAGASEGARSTATRGACLAAIELHEGQLHQWRLGRKRRARRVDALAR